MKKLKSINLKTIKLYAAYATLTSAALYATYLILVLSVFYITK